MSAQTHAPSMIKKWNCIHHVVLLLLFIQRTRFNRTLFRMNVFLLLFCLKTDFVRSSQRQSYMMNCVCSCFNQKAVLFSVGLFWPLMLLLPHEIEIQWFLLRFACATIGENFYLFSILHKWVVIALRCEWESFLFIRVKNALQYDIYVHEHTHAHALTQAILKMNLKMFVFLA